MFKPFTFSKMINPLKIAKPFLTGKTWALYRALMIFKLPPIHNSPLIINFV